MTTYTLVNPGNLVDGQPMHIADVLANFTAIQSVLNGNIDDSNLAGITGDHIATFVFVQSTASALWSIAHNFGKYPSIEVVDSGGNLLWPDVDYVDANNISVSFANPTSGKAYLN